MLGMLLYVSARGHVVLLSVNDAHLNFARFDFDARHGMCRPVMDVALGCLDLRG